MGVGENYKCCALYPSFSAALMQYETLTEKRVI